MPEETRQLIDRVRGLLAGSPASRVAVEDTLTEGYARALALDAERRRLDARMTELAGRLGDAESGAVVELTELAGRRSQAEVELTSLRAVLLSLRGQLAVAVD